jgi:CheY-like chemotaxis protein
VRENASILLVDDEQILRGTLAEALRERTYLVDEAEHGDAAIAALPMKPYDLLVTDIIMPGRTNGWDVAKIARKVNPKIAVIYMTGFNPIVPDPVVDCQLIMKPFSVRELIATIAAIP